MWTCVSYGGDAVFWNPDWSAVTRWATRQGGELEIRYDPYFRAGEYVLVTGNVDQFGDLDAD